MATVQHFKELKIFQLARELHREIHALTTSRPSLANDIVLSSQVKKSSAEVMDHIAHGFGTGTRTGFVQHLTAAMSSLAELQSQLMRCRDMDRIGEADFSSLFANAEHIKSRINALLRHLNQSGTSEQRQAGKENFIKTQHAARPLGAYPHARRFGNLLFLSGIGSRSAADNSIPGLTLDENGQIVSYDIAAECHSCFANVKAVLEASGSSWSRIIDVTVFLTNMKNDFSVYNKIYGEYFSQVEACRTTVEVKSLPTPIAIELKVIATVEDGDDTDNIPLEMIPLNLQDDV